MPKPKVEIKLKTKNLFDEIEQMVTPFNNTQTLPSPFFRARSSISKSTGNLVSSMSKPV